MMEQVVLKPQRPTWDSSLIIPWYEWQAWVSHYVDDLLHVQHTCFNNSVSKSRRERPNADDTFQILNSNPQKEHKHVNKQSGDSFCCFK